MALEISPLDLQWESVLFVKMLQMMAFAICLPGGMFLMYLFVGGRPQLGCEILLLEKVEKGNMGILVRFVLALDISRFDLQWASVFFVKREE